MSTSLLLEAEAKLAADPEGIFKEKLIALVEKHRDKIAFTKQGFLPPDEYEVAVRMENALEAALGIIRDYEPPAEENSSLPAGGVASTSINI